MGLGLLSMINVMARLRAIVPTYVSRSHRHLPDPFCLTQFGYQFYFILKRQNGSLFFSLAISNIAWTSLIIWTSGLQEELNNSLYPPKKTKKRLNNSLSFSNIPIDQVYLYPYDLFWKCYMVCFKIFREAGADHLHYPFCVTWFYCTDAPLHRVFFPCYPDSIAQLLPDEIATTNGLLLIIWKPNCLMLKYRSPCSFLPYGSLLLIIYATKSIYQNFNK